MSRVEADSSTLVLLDRENSPNARLEVPRPAARTFVSCGSRLGCILIAVGLSDTCLCLPMQSGTSFEKF